MPDGTKKLDLHVRGQARGVVGVQRVGRRLAGQEVGEFLHGQGSRSALVEMLARTTAGGV